MKFIVALTFLVFLAGGAFAQRFESLPLELQQTLLRTYDICDKNELLEKNPQDLLDLHNLDFPENPTNSMKCLAFCVFKFFGYMNENAELVKDSILEGLTGETCKETAGQIISECEGFTGVDNCDKAYNLFKCVMPKVKASQKA